MPTIQHTDSIEWPNGRGYTPCSREYADAIMARAEAHDAYRDLEPRDDGYAAAYEAWQRAEFVVDRLQVSGHLGQGVKF